MVRHGRGGRGDRIRGRLGELAGLVLHQRLVQRVGGDVGHRHVADGAVGALHGGRHAGVLLGAGAGREGRLRGGADVALPVGADGAQIAGEHVAVTGPVASVDRGDVRAGQVHARVQLGDLGVVPAGDVAHEDVGQHRAAEMQLVVDALHVVGDDGRAKCPRDLQAALAGGCLVARKRRVTGAEVDRPGGDGVDAAAGADRAVGDGDARALGIVGRPLRDQRSHQRAAGSGQHIACAATTAIAAVAGAGRSAGGARRHQRQPESDHGRCLHSSHSFRLHVGCLSAGRIDEGRYVGGNRMVALW